jgi:hypothetical protein
MSGHDHPPEGPCPPACPAWAEGAIELFALQRRYPEMQAACSAAASIEWLIVAPSAPGVELPTFLQEEQLVRLNLVVGRDCPEVLVDEWGVRVALTFNRRRQECALPWASVMAGLLSPPPPPARPRPRFGVIEGGKK